MLRSRGMFACCVLVLGSFFSFSDAVGDVTVAQYEGTPPEVRTGAEWALITIRTVCETEPQDGISGNDVFLSG